MLWFFIDSEGVGVGVAKWEAVIMHIIAFFFSIKVFGQVETAGIIALILKYKNAVSGTVLKYNFKVHR